MANAHRFRLLPIEALIARRRLLCIDVWTYWRIDRRMSWRIDGM